MADLVSTFSERGDLAHLALFLWASGASAALIFVLREYAAAVRRFDDFVRELARFNRRAGRGRKSDNGSDDGHIAYRAAVDPRRGEGRTRTSEGFP